MINMRQVKQLLNDIAWVKTQLEDFKVWRKKHEARHIRSDNGRYEQSLETSTETGETEPQQEESAEPTVSPERSQQPSPSGPEGQQ